MKKDNIDLEILIDIMSLITKYGIENIEKVTLLLKNQDTLNDTISILEKAVNLIKYNNNSHTNDVDYVSNQTIEKINTILQDKRIFKNVKEIEGFVKKYIPQGINTVKRSDMIQIFSIFVYSQNNEEQEEVLRDIEEYLDTKSQKEKKNVNDLKSWSDIIMNSSKEI